MGLALKQEQTDFGWQKVRLGDVAQEVKTVSHSPSDDGLEFYVGLEHLDSMSLRIQRRGIIAEDNPSFSKKFKTGQILFGKRRCYQKKAAVADFNGICSGDIIVIEPRDQRIVAGVLPFIIQSEEFFDWAEKTSAGSLSPRTKWKSLAEFEFHLPSIKRQQEILAIVCALECTLLQRDVLISSARMMLDVLLQELISGTRNNPKSKTVPISDLVQVIASSVDKKSKKGERKIRLCNYMDVYSNRNISGDLEFMTSTASEPEIRRFKLEQDDVVITKDSESPDDIAIPAHVIKKIQDLVCGYHLSILRPIKKLITGEYLSYVLRARKTRYDIYPFAQGMTRYGLSSKAYKKVKVYCPSLEEQNKICSPLSSLDLILESLECEKQKGIKMKHSLLGELLSPPAKRSEVVSR